MLLLFSNEIYDITHNMRLRSLWVCSEGPEGQRKSRQKNEFSLIARVQKLHQRKIMKINFSLRFFKSVKSINIKPMPLITKKKKRKIERR